MGTDGVGYGTCMYVHVCVTDAYVCMCVHVHVCAVVLCPSQHTPDDDDDDVRPPPRHVTIIRCRLSSVDLHGISM